MVECEFLLIALMLYREYGFNRYMVECESHMTPLKASAAPGFNRYMVECEWENMTAVALMDKF